MLDSRLEEQTKLLLSQIEGWSAERLQHKSLPAHWSALQVLDHLVKTEEEILDSAKHGTTQPQKPGLRDRLGNVFLKKIFESDRKVKVPGSASQVLPQAHPSLEEVLTRWRRTREDFAHFRANLTPEQTRLGIFRHPVAGWMNVSQIVEFFLVHVKHHSFQITRLAAESAVQSGKGQSLPETFTP